MGLKQGRFLDCKDSEHIFAKRYIVHHLNRFGECELKYFTFRLRCAFNLSVILSHFDMKF